MARTDLSYLLVREDDPLAEDGHSHLHRVVVRLHLIAHVAPTDATTVVGEAQHADADGLSVAAQALTGLVVLRDGVSGRDARGAAGQVRLHSLVSIGGEHFA